MDASLIRLLQLSSSALPVGGYTYSQGLEWAVECGWVTDENSLMLWLADLMENNLAQLDIPILVRMRQACEGNDKLLLDTWCQHLLAYRETSELRQEEINRGRALTRLLIELDVPDAESWQKILNQSQLAGLALASYHWNIAIEKLAHGYGWSWAENMVISGVKLIPLGQVAGQRILFEMAPVLSTQVHHGLNLADEEVGSSAPALAYASAKHETQYTRLYRS
jgi:urease accessory protein